MVKKSDNLKLKLKTVKNSDVKFSHVQDMYVNNMIYRPTELEYLSCHDMVTNYEIKKIIVDKNNW